MVWIKTDHISQADSYESACSEYLKRCSRYLQFVSGSTPQPICRFPLISLPVHTLICFYGNRHNSSKNCLHPTLESASPLKISATNPKKILPLNPTKSPPPLYPGRPINLSSGPHNPHAAPMSPPAKGQARCPNPGM